MMAVWERKTNMNDQALNDKKRLAFRQAEELKAMAKRLLAQADAYTTELREME